MYRLTWRSRRPLGIGIADDHADDAIRPFISAGIHARSADVPDPLSHCAEACAPWPRRIAAELSHTRRTQLRHPEDWQREHPRLILALRKRHRHRHVGAHVLRTEAVSVANEQWPVL
jgi:hypothetical protein